MCYVLICNVQCGIYCRGCMFAMCSYTPAMCYVLCALCCVQRGIYCAGAASEIDFAIIFNGVITTGYLLDAQQQMDIVKKWNLPMMAAAVFFFWGRCDQSQPTFCAWLLLPQSWKRKTTDAKRDILVNFGVNKRKNKWLAEGTKLCPCSRSQARLITINSSLMTL